MTKYFPLGLLPFCFLSAVPPNVIIIQTDEHNLRTWCYREQMSEDQAFIWGKGNKVETPNIDLIARDGLICTNYFAALPSVLHPASRCPSHSWPLVLRATTCPCMIPSSPLLRFFENGDIRPLTWGSGIWMGDAKPGWALT